MSKKKILVTGGAGYIGTHTVVELYQADYCPIVVDDLSRSGRALLKGVERLTGQPLVFHQGDCCDAAFLDRVFRDEAPIAGVIHFAAYKAVGESVQRPLLYFRNNVGALITLLEVMQAHGVRDLVFSSSCTVYGQPDRVPVTEDHPFNRAESPYGATKQVCERILQDAHHTGLRAVALRYFNPIGAHPSSFIGELPIGTPGNLVPFITQTAIGKRTHLVVFGGDYPTADGSCVRDYVHVMDVAAAHVRAFEFMADAPAQLSAAFNLGTGAGVSVLEVIRRFERATHTKVTYSIGPRRPGDVAQTYADPTRASSVLGWTPGFSLDDALLHAWNWEKTLADLQCLVGLRAHSHSNALPRSGDDVGCGGRDERSAGEDRASRESAHAARG
jgi:UDP-glucose 4-epimerase